MGDQFVAEASKSTQSSVPMRAHLCRRESCKKKQDFREPAKLSAHDSALPVVDDALNSTVRPLDSSSRLSSEPGLGHSISRVPVMPPVAAARGADLQKVQHNPLSGIRSPIQAKLAISQSGDAFEQEAERIAEKVMAMPLSPPPQERAPLIQLQRSSAQAISSPVPPIVDEVLRSPGAPLDAATREFMEPRFGHDFSRVRVHSDPLAERSARAVNALAFTAGCNIVFNAGQYTPQVSTGRLLLAHELVHVVQQNNNRADDEAGNATDSSEHTHFRSIMKQQVPVLQRQQTAQNKENKETPRAKLNITLYQMVFTPEPGATFIEGPTRPQVMAVILRRLLGDLFKPEQNLEETIFSDLESERPQNYPPLKWSGGLELDMIAEEGQPMGAIAIDNILGSLLVEALKVKFQMVDLPPHEEELIQLGCSSFFLLTEIRASGKLPKWYLGIMYLKEMERDLDYLRRYRRPDTPEKKGALVSSIIDLLLAPVKVMEAIRNDTSLAKDKNAGNIYKLIWDVRADKEGPEAQIQVPERLKDPYIGYSFLNYIKTQANISEEAITDRTARLTLMTRFGQRLLAEIQMLPAHPFKLTSSPVLYPPLYQTNQVADILYTMMLSSEAALDYLDPFKFTWEKLKVPADKLPNHEKMKGQRSKSEILERESRTLKETGKAIQGADPKKIRPDRATTSEFASSRFARATQYAQEDIKTIIEASGSRPGESPLTLVGANSLLRYLGTGLLLGVEQMAKPEGLLKSSMHIVFPEPGIYLVRCKAFIPLKGNEMAIRAPSVAYLPAFARDPSEIAAVSAASLAAEQEALPSDIEKVKAELLAPVSPEKQKELHDLLESLLASQAGISAVLELNKNRLIKRLDEVLAARDKAIKEGGEQGYITGLVEELDTIQAQLENIEAKIKTHSSRTPDLADAKPLVATFVGDKALSEEGHAINLNLEMVNRGVLPDGRHSVYVSDITTDKSGADTGEGKDLAEAIRDALSKILGSSQGYGRGEVSFVLGDKIETLRITSTPINLMNEAIQNVTLAISVAAMAAAPFTGGVSLAILVPVGMVGAIPSAYRLVESNRTGTFAWDINSTMDIVNVVSSFLMVGQMAAATRISNGVSAIWVNDGLMISGLWLNRLNVVLLGTSVIDQIKKLKSSNLSDSERTAQLLMILGNVMIQAGIMIGQKLVAKSYNLGGRRIIEERVQGGAEGEAIGSHSTGRTMAGSVPEGGKPTSATTRVAQVRNVRSRESLFEKLVNEGIRPNEPSRGPPPTTAIKPGRPRLGIKDVHEAYRLYDEAIAAYGGKREAGIFEDINSGEFAVCIGSENRVNSPTAGKWEGVLHYHPNPSNAKPFRMPAPADFGGLVKRLGSGKQPVREFLEYEIPGVGRGRTEFGIIPGSEKPYYVKVSLPDGSSSSFNFANDRTYGVSWGSEKIYVDPRSPLYNELILSIPAYLKEMSQAPTAEVQPKGTVGEGRTVAGIVPPASKSRKDTPVLMTPEGDLTDEGVAFLKNRYPRRFGKSTPEGVRAEFAEDPGGWLLEAVGKEEVRGYYRELGPSASSILLDKKKQNMRSVAQLLSKRVAIDATSLNMPVIEFVKTYMPEALDLLENHTTGAVREAWQEFAWGQTGGAQKGTSGSFLLGVVGNKQPDIIEVFPDRKLVIVTDTTHRSADPIHNFKTLFYALVMENMTGFKSGSVDYRSILRQNPVEIQARGLPSSATQQHPTSDVPDLNRETEVQGSRSGETGRSDRKDTEQTARDISPAGERPTVAAKRPDPNAAKKARLIDRIDEVKALKLQIYREIQKASVPGKLQPSPQERAELANEAKKAIEMEMRLQKELSELEITSYQKARAYSYSDAAAKEVVHRARGLDELSGKKLNDPSIDHIISVDRMVSLEGWGDLSWEDQKFMLSRTYNLVMMEKSLNSSKGNKRFANWDEGRRAYGDKVWDRMVKKENELERLIQTEINARRRTRSRQ